MKQQTDVIDAMPPAALAAADALGPIVDACDVETYPGENMERWVAAGSLAQLASG